MNRIMERTRDRDRAALPEPMRREVRLLGDILGEIIRDSGGPGLLADVERLRHAVIEARHGDHDAGDEIAGLVASWSLERAEQVARAFAVYFHLANLAEEHQRIRNLRERDTGTEPVRESLAAAVAGISHDAGPEHLRELHEQIDLLWRTSQLRVKAMDPIDEVRTVMTAFDETLFRGDAWLLRLGQGARPGQRHPAALRYPGPAGSLGY